MRAAEIASWLMPEKLHFADIAGVVFGHNQVAVAVHRDLADFADFGRIRVIEPLAVAGMRGKVAVEKEVDDAVAIHVPNLAAIVGRQETGASRQKPNAADLPKTGLSRRVSIAAATAAETVACEDGASAAVG